MPILNEKVIQQRDEKKSPRFTWMHFSKLVFTELLQASNSFGETFETAQVLYVSYNTREASL